MRTHGAPIPAQFTVDGVSCGFVLSVPVGVRALLVVVALTIGVAAGCSDDADDPPAAASTSSSATTSTTVGVDEVPDEITVEYVQRVMDALDASWGDMYRLYVDSGGPTAETAAWLDALYDGEGRRVMDTELGREAADDFENTRSSAASPVTEVEELVVGNGDCIYFVGERHYAEVFDIPYEPARSRGVVELRRATPSTRNPSAWRISLELDASSGLPEREPCA
jgi:hypothetical protein